jgi:hypothetical protein
MVKGEWCVVLGIWDLVIRKTRGSGMRGSGDHMLGEEKVGEGFDIGDMGRAVVAVSADRHG